MDILRTVKTCSSVSLQEHQMIFTRDMSYHKPVKCVTLEEEERTILVGYTLAIFLWVVSVYEIRADFDYNK